MQIQVIINDDGSIALNGDDNQGECSPAVDADYAFGFNQRELFTKLVYAYHQQTDNGEPATYSITYDASSTTPFTIGVV